MITKYNRAYLVEDVSSEEFKKFHNSEDPDDYFEKNLKSKNPKVINQNNADLIYKELIDAGILKIRI